MIHANVKRRINSTSSSFGRDLFLCVCLCVECDDTRDDETNFTNYNTNYVYKDEKYMGFFDDELR